MAVNIQTPTYQPASKTLKTVIFTVAPSNEAFPAYRQMKHPFRSHTPPPKPDDTGLSYWHRDQARHDEPFDTGFDEMYDIKLKRPVNKAKMYEIYMIQRYRDDENLIELFHRTGMK